jgi:hypothetical protein
LILVKTISRSFQTCNKKNPIEFSWDLQKLHLNRARGLWGQYLDPKLCIHPCFVVFPDYLCGSLVNISFFFIVRSM